MNTPHNIPPALAREIQAALAQGRPLPPGVVAVREGQAPPPGAVPTGISTQVPAAMAPQPPAMKAQHNPIPDGDDGLRVLRNFANCPIPAEAQKLQRMMQMVIQNPSAADDNVIDEVLSKGMTASMRANRYCAQNKKSRTVCLFSADEKLAALHQQTKDVTSEMEALNKQLEECVKRGNAILVERWEYAVKTYGLNPEKYLYHIDEDKGLIEQMDLDCDSCKGATIIRHARQEVTDKLMAPKPAAEAAPQPPTTEEKKDGE